MLKIVFAVVTLSSVGCLGCSASERTLGSLDVWGPSPSDRLWLLAETGSLSGSPNVPPGPEIIVTLTPESREQLRLWTQGHLLQTTAVRLDGMPVGHLLITKPIDDGKLRIVFDDDQDMTVSNIYTGWLNLSDVLVGIEVTQ